MAQQWRIGTTRIHAVAVEACWRPIAGDTAGDFHHLVEPRGDGFAVVVGDVMGSGPDANELAELLGAELRVAFRDHRDPAAVLAHLDGVVAAARPDAIVTAVCMIVDPDRGRAVISNAGHVPLVFAGPAGAVLCDEPPDPPLGLDYPDRHRFARQLAADLTVFAFTDGLLERKGRPLGDALDELACVGADPVLGPCRAASDLALRAHEVFGAPVDDVTVLSMCVVEPHPAGHLGI